MANIKELDPQVQIRIIELAWQWVKDTMTLAPSGRTQEQAIEARAKTFDQAYKAILKTVQPESESGGTIPVEHH